MKTNQIDRATPRPWKQFGTRVGTDSKPGFASPFFRIADAHNADLAGCANCGEAEANATLIVQAVNERDALIAVADAAERVGSAIAGGCDPEDEYLIKLNESLSVALNSLESLRASKGGQ